MTKYSGAAWRPLGVQTQPRMSRHDIVCVHTMVGYLTSTEAMFRKRGYGGTESHFGVGGKWGSDDGKDGVVYQWQDTDFTADANLDGNHRIISIETADNAPHDADDLAPWTDRQCEAIARIIAWACKLYNIPVLLVPDSKPGRRGIAYHRQGCEHSDGLGSHPGWLVRGGERWSTSVGKPCPGEARIKQLTKIVIPRVRALLNGDTDDMSAEDVRSIKAAIPTVADIVAALRPVIKAEAQAAAKAAVKDWENTVVNLGPFGGSILVDGDGHPTVSQKAGDLLEWAAAHAAATHALVEDAIEAGTAVPPKE